MAEITKDSTLREVLTSYANKNKRGSSFVTEGVKLFKDIADKKGSALQLFTPDKNGKTLISKKIEERKTLNVIDKKDIGSGLKQPMQNLRQVGLSLKTVIPESDKSYAYLPDKESSTPKNEKIFGTLEPAKAKAMVAVLQERGYKVVSNGTENHLLLLDLIDKDITGKDADAALGKAHITVNKNSVPNDPRSPFVTSGLRLGTPAISRRGFGIEETKALTGWICDILDDISNEETIIKVQANVKELCSRFPVYK